MGNARSAEVEREEDIWWSNGDGQVQQSTDTEYLEQFNATISQKTQLCETSVNIEREQRKKEMQEDFIKFKQELARKHEKRRQLIAEKKKEMMDLRDELIKEKGENERLRRLLHENCLTSEASNVCSKSQKTDESSDVIITNIKEENEELKNEVEKLKLMLREKDIIVDKNRELRISLAQMQKELQNVNTQIISFEKERIDYQEHVTALKDIIRVTKEMLRVRESQIDELKKKISSIEELLASKEISILSDDLRQEYERQLRNIRDLRILYEDRQRIDKREKQNLQTQIEELKKTLEDEQKKNGELTERVTELEVDNSNKYDKIVNLDSNLGLAKAECKEMHAEMEVINQLFSQILISFNNEQDVDLDNMIKILEENHDLLTNIVINDESNQTSALPKVLLDLVNRVNEIKKDNKDVLTANGEEETSTFQAESVEKVEKTEKVEKLEVIKEEDVESQLAATHQLNSPEEIVENLPKVWRVLIELLSHQTPPNNEITEKKGENDNHCYKSVETPTGLRKVLSVSKTFIRLKSLILEKKSLEKEMMRLKQLNTHLEGRLSDQEKRLVLVSNELSKTWNFVGKMQKQHQQLHTQEKILRYELAQKRKLLTELKEELEYCRQKWSQARKQNSSTEEQWKQLRSEFASRKTSITDDINNSVESGYSDDKSSSDDDEDAGFGAKKQKAEEVASQRLDESNINEENERVTNLNPQNLGDENQNQENLTVSSVPESESNNTGCIERVSTEEMKVDPSDTLKKNDELTDIEKLSLNAQETLSQHSSSLDGCHKTDVEETQQAEISSQDTRDEDVISITEAQIVPDLSNKLTQDNLVEIATSSDVPVLVDHLPTDVLDQSTSSSSQSNSDANLDKPSTSHKNPVEAAAEFAARREEKMKRLEEQCKDLYFSVAKNSLRGLVMSNKLDNLHEIYGEQSQNTVVDQTENADEVNENTEETQPNPDITDSSDVKDNQE
ncbi:hypothetical protein MML48_1g13324 [Holotrichia oblita]|uniref:Uncharacterized protein n=1 Tax=Holotrichia oblita TaxID=644536 RepID=A0ACB9TS75_HOLOL|nr:hypothetical protein MML48_1g13324 [Holotrichia oblita]